MKSRRLLLLLVALSPAVCFAEPSVTEESPSSSASSAPTQTYTVQVGLADHKFQPDTVQAGIGDVSSAAVFQTINASDAMLKVTDCGVSLLSRKSQRRPS